MSDKEKNGSFAGTATAVTAGAGAGFGTFAALAGTVKNVNKTVESVSKKVLPALPESSAIQKAKDALSFEQYIRENYSEELANNVSNTDWLKDNLNKISEGHSHSLESLKLEYDKFISDSVPVISYKADDVIINQVGEKAPEQAKNIFQKTSEFVSDKWEKFGDADIKVKIGIVAGTALAAVGTYIVVDKILNPKSKTQEGSMQYEGQVAQSRGQEMAAGQM